MKNIDKVYSKLEELQVLLFAMNNGGMDRTKAAQELGIRIDQIDQITNKFKAMGLIQ